MAGAWVWDALVVYGLGVHEALCPLPFPGEGLWSAVWEKQMGQIQGAVQPAPSPSCLSAHPLPIMFPQAETRAEFAERSVAKLEKTIDDLEGKMSPPDLCLSFPGSTCRNVYLAGLARACPG